MNNPIIHIICSFLIILLFAQCNSDNCEDITCLNDGVCDDGTCDCPTGYAGEFCEEQLFLLKNYSFSDDDDYYKVFFEYDSLDRLILATTLENDEEIRKSRYEYDGDSLVIRNADLKWQEWYTLTFLRPSSDMLIVKRVGFTGQLVTSNFSDLDPTCGYTQSRRTSNQFITNYNYTYTDNCDLTIERYDDDGNLNSTIEIVFDHNSNYIFSGDDSAFLDVLRASEYYYMLDMKNVVSQKTFDSDGVLIGQGSFESIFEFNENAYPIKETVILQDRSVEIFYEYY